MIGTSKNVKLEMTDAGSNESSKPSTDELHVGGKLDAPAAPVIIAGKEHPCSAAGTYNPCEGSNAGRQF
jgi:hypothetical protein